MKTILGSPRHPLARLVDEVDLGLRLEIFLKNRGASRGHASPNGHGVTYHGIDKCDTCGQPLEKGQSLCGLCKACETKAKIKGRPVETVKPSRGIQ